MGKLTQLTKLISFWYRLILLLNLSILLSLNSWLICPPAHALLRQHHETPDVLRYHAQESIKDKQGNAWQVVLFPVYHNSQATHYYLRLVGFPGLAEFIHPQPLDIITSEGKTLTASDVYATTAPAANVGQYDLTSIVSQLPPKGSLKLAVSLKNNRDLSLKVTKSMLTEWQVLIKEL